MTRWGLVGTGRMAETLAETMAAMPNSEVVGVVSASLSRAQEFASRHGIGRAFNSVTSLLAGAETDAVYVCGTNDRHHPDALAALASGKGVLCEKPMGLNLAQVREMVDASERHRSFLMEGMWMRFQPAIGRLLELIREGAIGSPRLLTADFSIVAPPDPRRRWFSPEAGGGALYDLGVYPIALSRWLWGQPQEVEVLADHKTGVDAQAGVVFRFPAGEIAIMSMSLVSDGCVEAVVSGTEGRIRLHRPFHHSSMLTIESANGQTTEIACEDLGYRPEVDETERCIARGEIESSWWSHIDSLALMESIERVRAHRGFSSH